MLVRFCLASGVMAHVIVIILLALSLEAWGKRGYDSTKFGQDGLVSVTSRQAHRTH